MTKHTRKFLLFVTYVLGGGCCGLLGAVRWRCSGWHRWQGCCRAALVAARGCRAGRGRRRPRPRGAEWQHALSSAPAEAPACCSGAGPDEYLQLKPQPWPALYEVHERLIKEYGEGARGRQGLRQQLRQRGWV